MHVLIEIEEQGEAAAWAAGRIKAVLDRAGLCRPVLLHGPGRDGLKLGGTGGRAAGPVAPPRILLLHPEPQTIA